MPTKVCFTNRNISGARDQKRQGLYFFCFWSSSSGFQFAIFQFLLFQIQVVEIQFPFQGAATELFRLFWGLSCSILKLQIALSTFRRTTSFHFLFFFLMQLFFFVAASCEILRQLIVDLDRVVPRTLLLHLQC